MVCVGVTVACLLAGVGPFTTVADLSGLSQQVCVVQPTRLATCSLESNVKVDCGAGRQSAQDLPVLRVDVPGVLRVYVTPMWREGLRKTTKKNSG